MNIGKPEVRSQRSEVGSRRQPGGLPESSRWSQSAKTTGTPLRTTRTPEGCQNIQGREQKSEVRDQRSEATRRVAREYRRMNTFDAAPQFWHPSRVRIYSHGSGGLREALRPPATLSHH